MVYRLLSRIIKIILDEMERPPQGETRHDIIVNLARVYYLNEFNDRMETINKLQKNENETKCVRKKSGRIIKVYSIIELTIYYIPIVVHMT